MLLGCLAGLFGPVAAEGQDQLRDFTKPLLVFNSGGHHAAIKAMAFTPDGRRLLTAGEDKVVNVWGLGGNRSRPALEATIRPPVWRGMAGNIHALALSTAVDERGRRALAVAGWGVDSLRGNIGLFLLPAPGAPAPATAEPFAQLVRDDPDDPRSSGHLSSVTSLAFNPLGTLLATASNDTTARIWDWKGRRAIAVLKGHASPINKLAFTPDGTRLITGGRDGTLLLWDVDRPEAPLASVPPPMRNPKDPLGVQINALDVGGKGPWVVIGREDGRILRYDAMTLAQETVISSRDEDDRVSFESMALSHAGDWLVTSSIERPRGASDLPRFDCAVRVRRFPGGEEPRQVLKLKNIAFACGFSPDGATLAVAGGDEQGVNLISNWRDLARIKADALRGQGASIWDVGLVVKGGRLAVGFSYDADRNPWHLPPRAPTARPIPYRGMILPGREITSIDPAELSRGLREFDGWAIRPIDQFHLEVSRADAPRRTFRIALDATKDRRWMCYSFIPPNPEHPRPMVAVGCDSGVWFYRFDDGRPTRLFSGHSGPVYCLAPSKDGRWLATGSSDQTVRLWTLAGCDVPPTLGTEFELLPDGTHAVKSVKPLGFGEAMGLRQGDVLFEFAIGDTIFATAGEFLARLDQPPNTPIKIVVRRKAKPPEGQGAPVDAVVGMYTSRRDGPALSLFLGKDREWVVWMPSGYYDTSIAGDTKFLGWHLNQSTIGDHPPRPTDYLEIFKFEKQLRQPRRGQPNKLDTLLRTGDLALALAVPYPPVAPIREPSDPVPPVTTPIAMDRTPRGQPAIKPPALPVIPPLLVKPEPTTPGVDGSPAQTPPIVTVIIPSPEKPQPEDVPGPSPAPRPPSIVIEVPEAPPDARLLARRSSPPIVLWPPPQAPIGDLAGRLPAPQPPPAATPTRRRPFATEPGLPPLSPAEIVLQGQPPDAELTVRPAPDQEVTPEKIVVAGRGPEGMGTLTLDIDIDAKRRSPPRSIEYRVDGRPSRPTTFFDQPVLDYKEAVKLALAPGPHRFTLDVENELGIRRTVSRDIYVEGLPRARPGRLKVLAIAPSFPRGGRIPQVAFADRDIKDLRPFLDQYLVSPSDGKPLDPIVDVPLDGAMATSAEVLKSFEALRSESLVEGDLVVVAIESHFLNVGGERRIAAADGRGIPPAPAIPADEVARHLGEVAKYKCKVVVLLDVVHPAAWDNDINEWVRGLRDEQNVITFVASNNGHSWSIPAQGHRAFAQAVLDSIRPGSLSDGPYLLNDFRDIVVERVLELTNRQQQAACYLPEAIGGQFPFLNPQAPRPGRSPGHGPSHPRAD